MNDLESPLVVAGRRLWTNTLLHRLAITLAVAAGIALVLMAATKVSPAVVVPWMWVGPALVVVAAIVATLLAHRARLSRARVALVVDERLDLRERLTTALHCRGRDDAFAQAAVEDARVAIGDPKFSAALRRRFPVQAPRQWYVAPLLALLTAGAAALPSTDLFSSQKEQEIQQASDEVRKSVDAALTDVMKQVDESEALKNELGDALGDMTKEGQDPKALKTPDQLRRDAIKKMTDLNQKLDDLINGEKGKTSDALKDALSQIKPPDEGPGKELAESLAKGDFSAAQKALEDMQKKLEQGQMNAQEKQQAQQQMADMAKQLEQLAEQKKNLEEALKQAGLDPQLANNAQALQEQVQNNQNLNQQQKQQLQQMAQAQQQACKMCQGMGQACKNMAQQMAQNGQLGQGNQQMQQMLNDAEMLNEMLKQAQAASKNCQGQCKGMGQGLAMQQPQQKNQGQGMGNWGMGAGGDAPKAPTPTGAKAVKENTKTQENAEIIAKQFIQGEPVVGEAKAKLTRVAAEVTQTYEEGLSEESVNPKYRDAHKRFFGEMKRRVEATQQKTDQAAPTAPPASDAPAAGGAAK